MCYYYEKHYTDDLYDDLTEEERERIENDKWIKADMDYDEKKLKEKEKEEE